MNAGQKSTLVSRFPRSIHYARSWKRLHDVYLPSICPCLRRRARCHGAFGRLRSRYVQSAKGSGERIQRQPSRRDHAADTEGSLPDSGRLYGKHSGSRDVQSSHLGLAGTTAGWHPERRSAAAQILAQAQRRTAEAGLAARVTLQEGTVDAPVTNIGLGRGRVLASTKPTRYDRFACPQAVTPIL